MKTKQELEALHRLFLSNDSGNWELGAMMCSLEGFNAVIDMEVERLANSEDFKSSKTKDEDSEGFEYEHKLMLGVGLCLFTEWGNLESDTWAVIERSWEIIPAGIDIAWTKLKYDIALDGAEKTSYWTVDTAGSRTEGPRNQYLTDDFAAELEAVKEYWRGIFKKLKQ